MYDVGMSLTAYKLLFLASEDRCELVNVPVTREGKKLEVKIKAHLEAWMLFQR